MTFRGHLKLFWVMFNPASLLVSVLGGMDENVTIRGTFEAILDNVHSDFIFGDVLLLVNFFAEMDQNVIH